jgi:hypothetical protein
MTRRISSISSYAPLQLIMSSSTDDKEHFFDDPITEIKFILRLGFLSPGGSPVPMWENGVAGGMTSVL